MKYQYLLLLFLILSPILIQSSEAYLTIPPTRAFSMINGSGGNVTANSYADFAELKNGTGITISFDYTLHEIMINASSSGTVASIHDIGNVTSTGCAVGQVLAVDVTGIWVCTNTAGSGVNSLNFTTSSDFDFNFSGNGSALTLDGQVFNFRLKNNVVLTNESAQTITKSLTLNSGILGGQFNIAGNTFLNTGILTFPTTTGTLLNNIAVSNTANTTSIIADNSTVAGRTVFKTLSPGTNISLTNDDNNIVISSTASGSGITNIVSAPQTTAVLIQDNSTSSTKVSFKTLTQGTGITLTNGTSAITIASSVTDTDTTVVSNISNTNATAIADNSTSTNNVRLKGFAAGTGIQIDNGTNTLIIKNTGALSDTDTTVVTNISNSNATLIADNTTSTNNVRLKNISAGTGIQIDNGTNSLIIINTVSGGFTNLASTSTATNATIIAENATTPRAVFKTISGSSPVQVDNGSSSVIIKLVPGSGGIPFSLASNVTTITANSYTTIFTIPMTSSSGNSVSGLLIGATNLITNGIQFATNFTNTNHRGSCTFYSPLTATTQSIDIMNASGKTGSASPDTGTAETDSFWAYNATGYRFDCSVYSSGAGSLVIGVKNEIAANTNITAGSFYIKTP